MTHVTARAGWTLAAYVLLAALAVVNSGCLLVATGAAGGAALGYVYYKGKISETYNARPEDTSRAVRTALGELGMPIINEEPDGAGSSIHTQTVKGDRVRVQLESMTSTIPAEGQATRVSVRVATFGDEQVSGRILTQIGLHLAPLGATAQTATQVANPQPVMQTAAGAAPPAATSNVQQTAPPPLLPPDPLPIQK